MKSTRNFLTLILAASAFFAASVPADARELVLLNFDDVSGNPFSFKDEKGSTFKVSIPDQGAPRKQVLSLEYKISRGGWAGWGAALDNMSSSDYSHLTFLVRGDTGKETFDVGIKDMSGVEKKLPLSQFAEIGKDWRKVSIPLKEFAGVNMASLGNINIGFSDAQDEGHVYLDQVQLEISDESGRDAAIGANLSNKVVIDRFERTNPTDIYLVYEGDESSLRLASARVAKEGDYAMELEYTLASNRPWGSWVAALWQSREVTLDWRGTQEVKLWVKGDGSGNIFRFFIRDADGERWIFEDAEVLKSTRWEQVVMPVKDFRLEEQAANKNGILDLDQVQAYSMLVVGRGGALGTSGVKVTVGRIQIDQLYIVGDQINVSWAVLPKIAEAEKARVQKVGNVEFNGQLLTEFLNAPEQKSTVVQTGKLITNGKFSNYSVRMEIASEGREFGETARYSAAESTNTGSTAVNLFSDVEMVNLQGIANNIHPNITQITVGNQFIDYSPFTLAPVFGFRGLSLEGDAGPANYHAFALKHRYDSFTTGSRLKAFWNDFRYTGIMVYFRETARIPNSATQTGTTLSPSTELKLEEVQNDWVYTNDLERSFFDEMISLGGTFGYNKFTQHASADRSDPFAPVFVNRLDPPIQVDGTMTRGRVGSNSLLIPGLKLSYEYRAVDTEFKPRYRQNPIYFDDLESDQRGHNARLTQSWRGWLGSVEYDAMKRNSNDTYYRNRAYWAVGYYGYDRLDVAFNQEIRRETYIFTSNRTGTVYFKNEQVYVSEVYIRAQLNAKLALFLKPRREDVHHPATGLRYVNEGLYGKLEYFATTNLKLLGEFRTTHYGVKSTEPQGSPFDDNFVRTKIEFNF